MRRPAGPIFLLLVLAVGASAPACRRQQAAQSENDLLVPVAVEPAALGMIRGVVSATGLVTALPGAEILVFAPQTARIAEITKAVGDSAKSGELLVRFELPSLPAESAVGVAALRAAEVRLKNAKAAQERIHGLIDRGATSRLEVEDADREVNDAEAEVRAARTMQSATEARGKNTSIHAPFNGTVTKRLHNPGDTVTAGAEDPILHLLDPKQVQVTASVSTADARRVPVGATARIVAEGHSTTELLRVTGRSDAEPGAPAVPVTLAFDSPTELAPETQVAIEIDAEQHSNAVLVPAIAVVRDAKSGVAVFVAAGGSARRRVVTTGLVDAEHVEIVSGLKPGELVITQGLTNVSDGSPITIGDR
jgi:membrane fusion protein (multidrug efflux system)